MKITNMNASINNPHFCNPNRTNKRLQIAFRQATALVLELQFWNSFQAWLLLLASMNALHTYTHTQCTIHHKTSDMHITPSTRITRTPTRQPHERPNRPSKPASTVNYHTRIIWNETPQVPSRTDTKLSWMDCRHLALLVARQKDPRFNAPHMIMIMLMLTIWPRT